MKFPSSILHLVALVPVSVAGFAALNAKERYANLKIKNNNDRSASSASSFALHARRNSDEEKNLRHSNFHRRGLNDTELSLYSDHHAVNMDIDAGAVSLSTSTPKMGSNVKDAKEDFDIDSVLLVDEADAESTSESDNAGASEVMSIASQVKSVNYFISRECNYSCKFCFHTQKNVNKLSLEKAKMGLKMLRDAGTEKMNFAGGEPFINDVMLGELCRYSHELGMAVSIISNGSLIKPYWMKLYGEYVDVLGVSIDSFNPEVNAKIGRGGDANNKHLERVLKVRQMCEEHSITFKMNTVVCNLNWEEDMTEYVKKLNPKRWKCFQVLILKDENSGAPGELRDAKDLVVSREQFDSFVKRHEHFDVLIPEPNDVMQNSYLLLDEELRFLDCSAGGKVPSESILDVGVGVALQQAGFDVDEFYNRGGIYDWTRERK